MRKLLRIGLIVGLAGLLAACGTAGGAVQGSGKVITESRPVSGLSAVELATVGTLIITQQGSESLTVEGEDNILPLIETTVQNGRLVIRTKPQTSFSSRQDLTYRLGVVALNEVTASSAGSVEAHGLTGERLRATTSSAGKVTLDGLNVQTLEAHLQSSGSMTAIGQAPAQEITLSSHGSFDGSRLPGRSGRVTVNSAGGATVQVSDTLDVTMQDGGAVRYIGAPAVTKSGGGSGSIAPLLNQ